MHAGALSFALLLALSPAPIEAFAQSSPSFSGPSGIPPQIIPLYGRGGPTGNSSGDAGNAHTGGITSDGGTSASTTGRTTSGNGGSNTAVYPTSDAVGSPTDTRELQTLSQSPAGSTAITTSDSLSVNPATTAAFASAESNFQNVPTANGSSSAYGFWQMTRPTFVGVSNDNGLGYTAADLTDPSAQAVVAPYYIQQIASTISAATGQPATTLQTYGGWVFGPDAGTRIASAPDSTSLNTIVSAQILANNSMTGWTVGDFRQAMSSRLGAAANQTALTTTGA